MPFFHDDQMTLLRTPIEAMTGSNAEMGVIQPFGAVDLRKADSTWQMRNQLATGAKWIDLIDQDFYIPDFRVVLVSVGAADPSATPDSLYHLSYDMPFPNNRLYKFADVATHPSSHGNADWFPTGVKLPCWITRIRFTEDTTATKITLWR